MEQKKAQIIEQAREQFHCLGYRGVRLSALISSMGISKPTFYNYFHNKQHLLDEVMLATYSEFLYEYARRARHAAGAMDALEIFVRTYAWFVDTYPIFRDVHRPGSDFSPVWSQTRHARDLYGDGLSTVRSIVEQGIGEGTFAPDLDPAEASKVVHAAVALLLDGPGFEPVKPDSLIRILARGVLAGSAGE